MTARNDDSDSRDSTLGDSSLADAAAAVASGKLNVPKDWYLSITRIVEAQIPHTKALGVTVESLAPGKVTLAMPYDARLAGDPETGVLHSGVITTLTDTAVGMAALSAMEVPRSIATLDLRIDHLRPNTPGERLIADAELVHSTRSIMFVRAFAHHGDAARPVAACASTFMVGSTGFAPDTTSRTS